MTLGLALLLAPGCDGEDVGDADADADAESGDGDTEDDAGDGDGDGEDDDTGGAKTGDGDGDGDGELMGCALLSTEADCLAESGCGPVYGNALVDDGDEGWCTLPDEVFIGCASSSNLCPTLGKTLCGETSVWYTTGCVPDNLTPCETPGGISGAC
ncbi:hypothetical protein ENSA5_46900 [Enhygromyxa salina]|uniref:Uncharacterized protein n=2 Tax=Enhygromyxa salina TaxID=215803 RepID=A0A2S9XJ07_9BACT|nr:hypothetical protein ENSA5_46900 [Enhygromyxa salina]